MLADMRELHSAMRETLKHDTRGFPPTIGQVYENYLGSMRSKYAQMQKRIEYKEPAKHDEQTKTRIKNLLRDCICKLGNTKH